MRTAVARSGSWTRLLASPAARRLLLISFLSQYVELALIRWVPMQVRLLAYFSNYILIAALLGLGLGHDTRQNRRRLVLVFAPGAADIDARRAGPGAL